MFHKNNGACDRCLEIVNKYPGFNKSLYNWFFNLQTKYPYLHVSCAGRGYTDQMEAFKKGVSRAVYGKSAHNYNCAIDVFFSLQGVGLYDEALFEKVIKENLSNVLTWYGMPDAPYHELPHIEINSWRLLVKENLVKLVEPEPEG